MRGRADHRSERRSGEGAPTDAELLALITSASVACGAHAGDRAMATRTCELAARAGSRWARTPGTQTASTWVDAPCPITGPELATLLSAQIDWLASVAANGQLRYLKLHGALYHQAAVDEHLAEVTINACRAHALALLAPPASLLAERAQAAGIPTALEGFPDRAYLHTPAGLTLAPRTTPGAMLGPEQAAEQARRLAACGAVRTLDGQLHPLPVTSLCVHGDAPDALATAQAIRAALEHEGITLRSFAA